MARSRRVGYRKFILMNGICNKDFLAHIPSSYALSRLNIEAEKGLNTYYVRIWRHIEGCLVWFGVYTPCQTWKPEAGPTEPNFKGRVLAFHVWWGRVSSRQSNFYVRGSGSGSSFTGG